MRTNKQTYISVAIPAYKTTFLKEAIDSVLAQTYSNFELIIVNDKSPEDIDGIISSYNDQRIRYYKNDYNLGKKSIVHNWNKCLSYAQGEFFTLLCDDELMESTFLEKMLQLTLKYPQHNVFKSRTKIINSINKTIIGESIPWPEYESFKDLLDNMILGNRKHTISEFIYRTNHIKKLNGYIVYPVGYYADGASLLIFCNGEGIISSSECLITFRKSEENISTNSKYNIEKAKAALIYFKWIKKQFTLNKRQIKILDGQQDFDLYNFYIHSSNIIDAIKILHLIPYNIWNYKKKIIFLLKKLF